MIRFLFATFCLFGFLVAGFSQRANSHLSPFLVGDMVDYTKPLINASGKPIVLTEQLQSKPSVLVFYRGGWCPFCTEHLSEIAAISDSISSLGFQVIAITPEDPSHFSNTTKKTNANYLILSDADTKLIQFLGIAIPTPKKYVNHFRKRVKGYLPTPTLYVVDKEKVIRFMHINPNYKERLSSEVLLAVLRNLAE